MEMSAAKVQSVSAAHRYPVHQRPRPARRKSPISMTRRTGPGVGMTPSFSAGGIPGVRKSPHKRIAATPNISANTQRVIPSPAFQPIQKNDAHIASSSTNIRMSGMPILCDAGGVMEGRFSAARHSARRSGDRSDDRQCDRQTWSRSARLTDRQPPDASLSVASPHSAMRAAVRH